VRNNGNWNIAFGSSQKSLHSIVSAESSDNRFEYTEDLFMLICSSKEWKLFSSEVSSKMEDYK